MLLLAAHFVVLLYLDHCLPGNLNKLLVTIPLAVVV
jgi:hypothetical protein